MTALNSTPGPAPTDATSPFRLSVREEKAILCRLLGENDSDAATLTELRSRIADEGLDYIYREIEVPILPVVRAMMTNGIRINYDFLEDVCGELQRAQEQLQRQIDEIAGFRLNLNSHEQLCDFLFLAAWNSPFCEGHKQGGLLPTEMLSRPWLVCIRRSV